VAQDVFADPVLQPVQVQDQACIQWTPALLEQVVLGVAVAGQFLFAPVTQGRGPPVDDPPSAANVRDDDTLYSNALNHLI
jgi:hypothetical protein